MDHNPIDKDKITENPHNLPYAHNVGGFVIKPIDKGRVKGNSISAMHEQTNVQMKQIYDQMEVLVKQANKLKRRVEISRQIYLAEMRFEPVIAHRYHLYKRKNGNLLLSMISPAEWGRSFPFEKYIASVKLLSDHTWKILNDEEEEDIIDELLQDYNWEEE